jgi:hypothetical protein
LQGLVEVPAHFPVRRAEPRVVDHSRGQETRIRVSLRDGVIAMRWAKGARNGIPGQDSEVY